MKKTIVFAALLALAVTSCGRDHVGGPSVSDYSKKRAALKKSKKGKVARVKSTEVVKATEAGFGATEAIFTYDPAGRRDPFRSYILEQQRIDKATRGPLERFDLAQLKLDAVIWDTKRERALIRDPSGRGYVVQTGTSIGKNSGRVVRIGDSVVVVEETYVNHIGERTMKNIEMRITHRKGG